jgi:ADP-ribose pyrophosphatase YjhB (NUDIX family)
VIDGDRVLLIKRGREPNIGLWTLPGGRIEPGETPKECARRELREELGVTVGPLSPVATVAAAGYRLAVFAAQGFSGQITPSSEVAQFRWATHAQAALLPTTSGLDEVLAQAWQRASKDGRG